MADRRQVIVQAALDEIAEGGLAAFTQTRVAKRAGLRQGHLTYYFPTRDELLFAVTEEAVEQRLEALRAAQADVDPGRRLRGLADVLTSPRQTRILIALAQGADQFAEVRASFDALAEGVVPLSAALLRDFGVAVDASTATLLQATSTGLAVIALARGAEGSDLGERLLRELLAGLAALKPAADADPTVVSGGG
jgi:AcrR family transcriptional regulator